MTATDDTKLQILHEHYNLTCDSVKEQIKRRDWLMVYVVVFLVFQFFQISDPSQVSNAVLAFAKNSYGIEISINRQTLEAILWFSLLAGLIRYYQTSIFINKQYKYLHHLENQFSKYFGENVLTREGKNYLEKYPLFSDWLHIVYSWVYPVFLICVLTYSIFSCWGGFCSLFGTYGISFACYLMIVFSTGLYLAFVYETQKSYKHKGQKK